MGVGWSLDLEVDLDLFALGLGHRRLALSFPLTFDADTAANTLVEREIENWDISAISSSPSISTSRSRLLDVVVRNDSYSSSPTPFAISASSCVSSSSRFFCEGDQ